jgi:hypothetical protein
LKPDSYNQASEIIRVFAAYNTGMINLQQLKNWSTEKRKQEAPQLKKQQ